MNDAPGCPLKLLLCQHSNIHKTHRLQTGDTLSGMFFFVFFWLLSRHVDVFFSLSLLYSVHAGLVTFGLYHTIKKKVLRPDSVSFRSLSAVHRLILTVFLQRKFFLFFFLFSHSSHRQMNGLFCCVYKCTYNGRKAILFKCPHTPTFSRSPYTKCNSCPCPHY